MEKTKTVDTWVRLRPSEIGTKKTTEQNLLNKLTKKYTEKCFNGCYVKSINRVLRKGQLISDFRSSNGSCNISVELEINIIEYNIGDVITDAVVDEIKLDPVNLLFLLHNNTKVLLGLSPSLRNVVKKEKIPVVINQTEVPIGGIMGCSAELLRYPSLPYFRLSDDAAKYSSRMDDYKLPSIDKKLLSVYTKIDNIITNRMNKLFGFKLDEKKIVNLSDFKKLKKGTIIGKPENLNRLSGIYISDKLNVKPIEENPDIIFKLYLDDYLKFIRAFNEISKNYDLEKLERYFRV